MTAQPGKTRQGTSVRRPGRAGRSAGWPYRGSFIGTSFSRRDRAVGAHSTGEAVWGPGRRPETSPTRGTNSAPPVLRCGPPSRCAGATSSQPRPAYPPFSPVVEFRLFYEISCLALPLYHSTIGRPLLSSFLICKRIDRDLGSCLGAQPGHPSVSGCRRHRSPPNDFFNSATTTELTTAGSRCNLIVVCLLAQDLSLAWRGLILS